MEKVTWADWANQDPWSKEVEPMRSEYSRDGWGEVSSDMIVCGYLGYIERAGQVAVIPSVR